MIGVVFVTNGDSGAAFLEILGMNFSDLPQNNIRTINVPFDCERMKEDGKKYIAAIQAAIEDTDEGQGVILLTDSFDFPSTRLAITAAEAEPRIKTEILSGVNMPMVVKLATIRGERSFEDTVAAAQAAARKYIINARDAPANG